MLFTHNLQAGVDTVSWRYELFETVFDRGCELKSDVCAVNLTMHECVLSLHHANSRICCFEILYGQLTCDCDCFMLMVCTASPTESPGDDQRGVRGFAWLEAGELEESQRTFLNV